MARSFYLQGRLSRHTWQTPPTRGRTRFDDGFVVLVEDKTHGRHYVILSSAREPHSDGRVVHATRSYKTDPLVRLSVSVMFTEASE